MVKTPKYVVTMIANYQAAIIHYESLLDLKAKHPTGEGLRRWVNEMTVDEIKGRMTGVFATTDQLLCVAKCYHGYQNVARDWTTVIGRDHPEYSDLRVHFYVR